MMRTTFHRFCTPLWLKRQPTFKPHRWKNVAVRTSPEIQRPNRRGEPTADFTPYILIHYNKDPGLFCKHRSEIVVDAPIEHCFQIWNKWDNLVDFLDLIGEISLEEDDPSTAAMFCYYRYDTFPILQIMMYLQKTEIKENAFIKFRSTIGMPLGGIVEFEEIAPDQTRVELRFEHAMPSCLLQVKIGVYGVENHMKTILEENMATFKLLAEGKLPFSEDKYDSERALEEWFELQEAYHRSGWLSTEEDYQPSNVDDFGRELREYEMFPEEDEPSM